MPVSDEHFRVISEWVEKAEGDLATALFSLSVNLSYQQNEERRHAGR